jgi:hypothetical protein
MSKEFCPDCGHLLSKASVPCMFCGWSEDVDPFLCKGCVPVLENDLIFGLVDDVVPGQELRCLPSGQFSP